VFISSNIRILVDRETLYDYMLKHKDYEKMLKGIQRAYSGVMNEAVDFSEQRLAQFLQIAVTDLEKILHRLHNDGIIEYRLKKDKPQLTFLKERIDSQALSIDYTLYMFRKKRAEYRYKKAIEYAELAVCRAQQLLNYFGQTDAEPCGICDVCVEKNKADLDSNDFEIFKEKITRLLKREPLTLKEIADSFTEKHRTKVIQTIGFMMGEGIVKKVGEKFEI
jgi:ATP-dependent DNA helicase RecQ